MSTATINESTFLRAVPGKKPSPSPGKSAAFRVAEIEENRLEKWRQVFAKLKKWSCSLREVDEEGRESPSAEALSTADLLAEALRARGESALFAMVQNGEGGITFERRSGITTELFEIDADGSAEFISLHDSQVSDRHSVKL